MATDVGGFGRDGEGSACIFPKRNMAADACCRCPVNFRRLETRVVGSGQRSLGG